MRYAATLFLLILMLCSCGKKADPLPKSTLDMPKPDDVILSVQDDGLHITNSSKDYKLLVERLPESEAGAFAPQYSRVAMVGFDSTFVDNTTRKGEIYRYRFRNYVERYNTYSAPVVKTVSYVGSVKFESVTYSVDNDRLCLDIIPNENTSRIEVYINGTLQKSGGKCYPMPDTTRVLLLVIPYSDTDARGIPYSEQIERDLSVALLPPQQIKILESSTNLNLVSISWASMPRVDGYRVTVKKKGGVVSSSVLKANIFSYEVHGCVIFELSTVRGGEESSKVNIEACR